MNSTYLELGIQQYMIKSLKELEMKEKINEHTILHMTALLYDEQEDADIYNTKAGTQITLQQRGEQQQILFQGIVKKTTRSVLADT